MGHTRRIAKGGAATPDIFQDPFVDKQPPPGHESFSAEDKKIMDELYITFAKSNEQIESMPSFFKRMLKHFYARWKKIDPLPDPLDASPITEDQRKEMENYIESKKTGNPKSSFRDLAKDFLYEIFGTKDFSELKKSIIDLESANKILSNGLIANHQGGEPDRLISIISRPLKYIDLDTEIHVGASALDNFYFQKGISPEVNNNNTHLKYDSLIYSVIESHFQEQKEDKERYYASSKILFKENTDIAYIFFNPLRIAAVYLIEKEYMKAAWNDNSISSFSKNIGDYMRQSGDGLELWNQSKWISLGDISSLENIYLWHERFLILDKTSFEYINLLDVENQEKETDEEKQKFFEETKAAIEDIISSENKREALETIRTKLRRRQFLLKAYESIKDQKILLMDPETMAFLYTQTPSLWATTGFKRYDDAVPEQNIIMIMLLQYVRILSDFQKKKQNKISALKAYPGIGLLKDSLQDTKIQNEILEILNSKEAWNRFLEKQVALYKGFESPIQTMDQLKAFLADVQNPLEMKAILPPPPPPPASAPAPVPDAAPSRAVDKPSDVAAAAAPLDKKKSVYIGGKELFVGDKVVINTTIHESGVVFTEDIAIKCLGNKPRYGDVGTIEDIDTKNENGLQVSVRCDGNDPSERTGAWYKPIDLLPANENTIAAAAAIPPLERKGFYTNKRAAFTAREKALDKAYDAEHPNAVAAVAPPVAPPAAPLNTSFLSVFKQPSYFDPKTQTFPNLEKDILDEYSYAKEGKEQLKEESDPVKSPEIETVYSSGNNNDCLIHSFLTNISPAFRRLKQEDKNEYASYYRREVLPTFYKDKDEEAKKQMLYQKVYLDESHAFKLSNIFRVNILFMQAVERNAFKENGSLGIETRIAPVILNKEKEEEYKNRPWYVIYNPNNQHFRGMRHTEKSKGFIFTRKDIDTLIKNYDFEPDPKAVEAAAAIRRKEKEERNLAKAMAESMKPKGGTRTTRKKNRS